MKTLSIKTSLLHFCTKVRVVCAQGSPIRSIPTLLILAVCCETESHWHLSICKNCLTDTFSFFSTVSLAPLFESTLSCWHLPLCDGHTCTHTCVQTPTKLQTNKTFLNPLQSWEQLLRYGSRPTLVADSGGGVEEDPFWLFFVVVA